MQIEIHSPPAPPTLDLRRVRWWGDPVLVQDGGLSTAIVNTSNFQAVGVWNRVNGWGGVQAGLHIPHADFARVEALQLPDPNWTAHQKMAYLAGKYEGKVYQWFDPAANWETDTLKWVAIALGGNIVQVDGYETLSIRLPNSKIESIEMARLVGFTPADWERPLDDLLANGLVHRVWCANRHPVENTIADTPHGIIYNPFYSPQYWRFTEAAHGTPDAWYIPARWLV